MKNLLIISVLIAVQIGVVAQIPQHLNSGSSEIVLIDEPFNYPDGELPGNWWSEGAKAKIKNGKLYVDANHTVSTIWLDRVFPGDLRIEFDAHIISSTKNANNINCFFMYSDTTDAPLHDTRELRKDGNYKSYHQLNGYILTFVNDSERGSRFRIRDCPGFHLIAENYTYVSRVGKTYHIIIEKKKNNLKVYVDDKLVIDETDNEFNPVHNKGLFGFRTWHTELWWDNLLVIRL